ncbi:hypothetical protein B1813_18865 [Saccharomonospora piscinae]|uniref:HNH endonuclease n=1 Tax=Saccharomonospora piscinae TaxID=687388 RepID=A0A1V8ZYZ7_SACPI|nr:hypothetical protein [Saccharomonospora piscinae]OQO89904.1 hypothetical protein B1813_18865 [Saccharomonospora piscinae]
MKEKQARRIVRERSGDVCEVQLPGCQGRAREWHHRRNRSQGGPWAPSNGLHLCHPCHRWITEHPAESYDEGWMVPSWDDWEVIPVKTWHGYVLLGDDGELTNHGQERPGRRHVEGCPWWHGGRCDCGGLDVNAAVGMR